jgi:hypothetical protein
LAILPLETVSGQNPVGRTTAMGLNKYRRWVIVAVLLTLFSVYVSSYVVLSRRGFAQADEWHADGFYFFTPQDSTAWRFANYSLVVIYYPLIFIDNALGTGRPIAHEPLWRLSAARPEVPSNNARSQSRFAIACGDELSVPLAADAVRESGASALRGEKALR